MGRGRNQPDVLPLAPIVFTRPLSLTMPAAAYRALLDGIEKLFGLPVVATAPGTQALAFALDRAEGIYDTSPLEALRELTDACSTWMDPLRSFAPSDGSLHDFLTQIRAAQTVLGIEVR